VDPVKFRIINACGLGRIVGLHPLVVDSEKSRDVSATPETTDLVGTVIFLASDDSDFMTGQSIGVDGGMNMH
jgi:NAD(P)-dependent dehydrogenase (short-subunit alcohol dehydrogenase family)